jgi:hypothetical protein
MKLAAAISTAVLTLTLGVGIPAFAQQEQHDQQEENKDKPAQEKEKKAEPEKAAKQPEAKSVQEEKKDKPEERKVQEEKSVKPEEKNVQERTPEVKPAQRAGGGRIPEDRYKANFGRDHRFHVNEGDYRNHRFQYSGYWFGFVDPWPSNWLYTQDVFVVEIDGMYYLCNASYPGVNLALSVTL